MQDNKDIQYKSISFSLSGVVTEIKKKGEWISLSLKSDTNLIVWCFYKGNQNVDEWLDKNVIACGSMSKSKLVGEKTGMTLGYECVFTIFKLIEKKAKPVDLNVKVIKGE